MLRRISILVDRRADVLHDPRLQKIESMIGHRRARSIFFSCLRRDAQFPLTGTGRLSVVSAGGITDRAGDLTSFGFIGISEIVRSLP
jgi:hypothetical protein